MPGHVEEPARPRGGRPKRAPQMLPSALSAPLARTRVTFEIPTCTVAELRNYVAWIAATWRFPEREVQARALDEAVRRFLRNDLLWREVPRTRRNARATAEAASGVGAARATGRAQVNQPRPTPTDIFDEPTAFSKS